MFQLVRATDDEIVIWHTELGHIYGFVVCPDTDDLRRRFVREAPDAAEPADLYADEALRSAVDQARQRQLIGQPAKRRRRSGCSPAIA